MSKKGPRKRDMRDPNRNRDSWADREAEFEARPFWTSFKWTALAVVGVLAIIAIIWVAAVGSSGIQGEGNKHRIKNDATNQIQQSEGFEEDYQDFQAFPAKIKAAKSAVDAAVKTPDTTDDTIRATDLTGITQACIDLAHDYNARARKYTAKDFRASDLPDHLDDTECEAS